MRRSAVRDQEAKIVRYKYRFGERFTLSDHNHRVRKNIPTAAQYQCACKTQGCSLHAKLIRVRSSRQHKSKKLHPLKLC